MLRWMPGLARTIESALAIGLAITWFAAAMGHARNPFLFLGTIYQYQLLGASSGRMLAVAVPAFELTLGACLLTRQFLFASYGLSAAILAVFATAQASVLARGLSIGCGCFGAGYTARVGWGSLSFTCTLAATACLGAFVIWRLRP